MVLLYLNISNIQKNSFQSLNYREFDTILKVGVVSQCEVESAVVLHVINFVVWHHNGTPAIVSVFSSHSLFSVISLESTVCYLLCVSLQSMWTVVNEKGWRIWKKPQAWLHTCFHNISPQFDFSSMTFRLRARRQSHAQIIDNKIGSSGLCGLSSTPFSLSVSRAGFWARWHRLAS